MMDQDATDRFEQIHAAATELMLLHASASKIGEPSTLHALLREVIPTDQYPHRRLLLDRALGVPNGTVYRLRDGLIDPLTVPSRPLALLGRSMDLKLDDWLELLAAASQLSALEKSMLLCLVWQAWARAEEDDPLPSE
jgi:hypothetical protein